MKYTAKFRTTAPPQPVLFSLYDEEPGGRRLASLAEPAGPQERIQRRTVEQFAELVPMVQILDAPVPQTVDQLVEVLRPVDTMVPEQLIDVPKITSQDAIPQRAVLRVPQMAEQLVDEPLPFFDNFELVQVSEEEEEEDEHPQVVPGSRVSDAHGRSWCRVVGPAGVYWWMIGTSTAQSPGQGRIEILAVVGDLVVDVPVTMQRQFPASSRSSCLRSVLDRMVDIPVCYGYSGRKLWRFRSCRSWIAHAMFDSGYIRAVFPTFALRTEKCAQSMLRPPSSFFPRKPGHYFYKPLVF